MDATARAVPNQLAVGKEGAWLNQRLAPEVRYRRGPSSFICTLWEPNAQSEETNHPVQQLVGPEVPGQPWRWAGSAPANF